MTKLQDVLKHVKKSVGMIGKTLVVSYNVQTETLSKMVVDTKTKEITYRNLQKFN